MSRSINLNLYCDEIKESIISDPIAGNEHWSYIGILIVPVIKEAQLISTLCNYRCGNPKNKDGWNKCPTRCTYHTKNDKEIHYSECKKADLYHIGKRWINFGSKDGNLTSFYILGINLTNLDYSCFGSHCPSKRFEIIYNRFFRTAILKSVKSYYHEYDSISIDNILHDNSEIADDYYFPWHSIYRIEKDDPKIVFKTSKIEFIDSDHKISGSDRSHLIQYIDILMGSIFNALHWESKNEKKQDLAMTVVPLLSRMIQKPLNRNSSYNYYNNKVIEFFPSRRLFEYTDFPINGTFYKTRELRILRKNQPRLFD